ncbi:HAD family hydrolase [Paenibacillus dendritiformis]|uniref:HAD family hydrolase n=1 Tax=Paenibacillus dendritiformis TaxID=130049 RepID=UPI00143DCE3A|nr:HAD family hydrolase [Paenibacillus dendritiformis]NKI20685.1 HAD family hydrolase [Paenibacillus dendritiformis]NRF96571.1 HAD family hydrolase [Paenibacillus dendritiformis]
MIKGICFDLGGTLVQFNTNERMIVKLSKLLQIELNELKPYIAKHFLTQNNHFHRLAENFCMDVGYSRPHDIIEIIAAHKSEAQLFPDSRKILNDLKKNYKLGIISNAYCWNNKSLDELNLAGYFDECTIYSFNIGYAKPSKEIFKAAEEKLKLKRGELVFIGDSLTSDINGANNAGWTSVFINRNRKKIAPGECKANMIINELSDLLYFF